MRLIAPECMGESEHPAGISASLAANRKGGFRFAFYKGGLNSVLFVTLFRRTMKGRRKPLHPVQDGLPVHKAMYTYGEAFQRKMTLHLLPGYAYGLSPEELIWSYAKRTNAARSSLRAGEKQVGRVHAQLNDIAAQPSLVCSFFRHPSAAFITGY